MQSVHLKPPVEQTAHFKEHLFCPICLQACWYVGQPAYQMWWPRLVGEGYLCANCGSEFVKFFRGPYLESATQVFRDPLWVYFFYKTHPATPTQETLDLLRNNPTCSPIQIIPTNKVTESASPSESASKPPSRFRSLCRAAILFLARHL